MIGCGKMGGALLQYWNLGPDNFTIVDPALEIAPDNVRLCAAIDDLGDQHFDVTIVAVKPQMIDKVLPAYKAHIATDGYLLSMAAGTGAARLSKLAGDVPVIRVMPNLPAAVGQGVSGLFAQDAISPAQADHAMSMMDRTGTVISVDSEDRLDRVTAVAGSGPGYVFELARAYVAAAIEMGFSESEARRMVLGTMAGAVAMARDDGAPGLEELRNSVTSKGGTTAAGLEALNGDAAMSHKFRETLQAAYNRAIELR